eukprot:7604745-Lingulodinium_polyedra.AAC.1
MCARASPSGFKPGRRVQLPQRALIAVWPRLCGHIRQDVQRVPPKRSPGGGSRLPFSGATPNMRADIHCLLW